MPEPAANDGHVHITSRHAGSRASAADLLAEMDSAGVLRTAVVTPSTLGWDNSITFEAVAAAPDRFVAIARVDLRSDDAVEALREVIRQGARGVRITLFGQNDLAWLGAQRMDEIAAVLADHAAIAEFHCEPLQLATVGEFAARHGAVTVLVDHLGRPVPGTLGGPEHLAFLALATLPNVFVKSPALGHFSELGFPYSDIAPFISAAIDRFGADRLMWSSDWPGCYEFGSYRLALEGMLAALAGRSEQERQAVLTGTFVRLFGAPR